MHSTDGRVQHRLIDTVQKTGRSPVNGSEGVDSGIVTAIVVSRSTENALLTDGRPEILLVDSQCCLPNAIEPTTNKPPVSLREAGASVDALHQCTLASTFDWTRTGDTPCSRLHMNESIAAGELSDSHRGLYWFN